MNLKLMLRDAVECYGRKTAIVFDRRRLSYAGLDKASNKVANALLKMGIGKGDRVAMLLPNSLEFIVIYFGIAKVGGIAVLLDVKYKISELASLFNNCQPKVLVTENAFLEPLISVLPRFKSIKHVINVGSKIEDKFLSYRDIIAKGSTRKVDIEVEPETVAHIAYSSGPAFHPRGVMVTQQNLVTSANISIDALKQTDKDVLMLFALPLHHAFGLVAVLLATLIKGGTVVILSGLSISHLTRLIERERATIFMGVPFVLALAAHMAEEKGIKYDTSSLRLCLSGGATLPADVTERFEKCYGIGLSQYWGLTEAVCSVTYQPAGMPDKSDSVGRALPGYEIKVVDDNDRELPCNQTGEVIVRGPTMKGYYENPEATAAVIRDGWLHTGDLGKIDEDGWLFLSGRKKDIIITKGQNIHPSDIKEVLLTHPKVAEAEVVGIPDRLRGEVVRAVISLKKGESAKEQEIIKFCLKHLANYKLPKQIIFVDSLPRTATGRILKEQLKELLPT